MTDAVTLHRIWFPLKPGSLPPLGPICDGLISQRFLFMQTHRLRYEGNYGIDGHVINVPVDVNKLLSQLEDDFAFHANIWTSFINQIIYGSKVAAVFGKPDAVQVLQYRYWLEYARHQRGRQYRALVSYRVHRPRLYSRIRNFLARQHNIQSYRMMCNAWTSPWTELVSVQPNIRSLRWVTIHASNMPW